MLVRCCAPAPLRALRLVPLGGVHTHCNSAAAPCRAWHGACALPSCALPLLCPRVRPAGLSRVGPLVEQPLREVEEVLNTNVLGVVRVTQARAAAMRGSRRSRRPRVPAAARLAPPVLPLFASAITLQFAASMRSAGWAQQRASSHTPRPAPAPAPAPLPLQAVAPHMARQRAGLIVMVGSVTSFMATPFAGIYSASKAALLALADSLRLELQPFGVGVCHVTAGSIK